MARFGAPTAVALAAALVVAPVSRAMADDLYSSRPAARWADALSEVRVGIMAHGASFQFLPIIDPPTKWDLSDLSDVAFDLLFRSPQNQAFQWIGSPRPNFGGTINFSGKESLFHAGLTWHAQLFSSRFYLEGTFGAAAQTGYLSDAPPGHRNMGCRVNFYEVFAAGMDVTQNLTATLTWEHTSNASLCPHNDALTNIGMRVGYKF